MSGDNASTDNKTMGAPNPAVGTQNRHRESDEAAPEGHVDTEVPRLRGELSSRPAADGTSPEAGNSGGDGNA